MEFTEQNKRLLVGYFLPDEHEVRVLRTVGKKVSHNWKKEDVSEWAIWSVYIKRDAIINRLNNHFFGEWASGFLTQPPCQYHKTHVDCSMHMTIKGVRMEYNGSQSGTGEHAAKGAATDAFKRVASQWGMGLYLQHPPTLMTKNPETVDKNTAQQFEKDMLRTVSTWVEGLRQKDIPIVPDTQIQQESPKTMVSSSTQQQKMSKTLPNSSRQNAQSTGNKKTNRCTKVILAFQGALSSTEVMTIANNLDIDWENTRSAEIIKMIEENK